jgi:hypothetical protein
VPTHRLVFVPAFGHHLLGKPLVGDSGFTPS